MNTEIDAQMQSNVGGMLNASFSKEVEDLIQQRYGIDSSTLMNADAFNQGQQLQLQQSVNDGQQQQEQLLMLLKQREQLSNLIQQQNQQPDNRPQQEQPVGQGLSQEALGQLLGSMQDVQDLKGGFESSMRLEPQGESALMGRSGGGSNQGWNDGSQQLAGVSSGNNNNNGNNTIDAASLLGPLLQAVGGLQGANSQGTAEHHLQQIQQLLSAHPILQAAVAAGLQSSSSNNSMQQQGILGGSHHSANLPPASPTVSEGRPPMPNRMGSHGGRAVPNLVASAAANAAKNQQSLRSRRGLPDLSSDPANLGVGASPSPTGKRQADNSSVLSARLLLAPAIKSPRGEGHASPASRRGIPASPTGLLAGELTRLGVQSLPTTPLGSGAGGSVLGSGEEGSWLGSAAHGLEGTSGPSRLHLGESANQRGYGNYGIDGRMKDGSAQVSGVGLDDSGMVVFGAQGGGKGGMEGAGDGLDDGWGGDGLGLDDGRDEDGVEGGRNRQKHSTKPRSVAERLRREKIASRLKKLKDVMPKTDARIDTSGMLEDAVIYIRSLQARCKALERQNAVLTGQVAEYARLVGELPSQHVNGGM